MSDAQDETTENRDSQYSEVSLRAVELLARAQRTADEAVAEAQAYARDLEASARAQYGQILQRAQVAARDLQTPKGDGAAPAAGQGAPAASGQVPAAVAQEVEYVRTYARVAHAQVKTVLTALTDELDRLAEVAAGRADAHADVSTEQPQILDTSWPTPPDRVAPLSHDAGADTPAPAAPSREDDADGDDDDADGSPVSAPRSAAGRDAQPAGVWTRPADDSDARPTGWRAALQRKS